MFSSSLLYTIFVKEGSLFCLFRFSVSLSHALILVLDLRLSPSSTMSSWSFEVPLNQLILTKSQNGKAVPGFQCLRRGIAVSPDSRSPKILKPERPQTEERLDTKPNAAHQRSSLWKEAPLD
jgi:hypothetical protein